MIAFNFESSALQNVPCGRLSFVDIWRSMPQHFTPALSLFPIDACCLRLQTAELQAKCIILCLSTSFAEKAFFAWPAQEFLSISTSSLQTAVLFVISICGCIEAVGGYWCCNPET